MCGDDYYMFWIEIDCKILLMIFVMLWLDNLVLGCMIKWCVNVLGIICCMFLWVKYVWLFSNVRVFVVCKIKIEVWGFVFKRMFLCLWFVWIRLIMYFFNFWLLWMKLIVVLVCRICLVFYSCCSGLVGWFWIFNRLSLLFWLG